MKWNILKKTVVFVLVIVLVMVLAGCQNSGVNKLERKTRKYLKEYSIVPEMLYVDNATQAKESLEVYLWHMEQNGKDTAQIFDLEVCGIVSCNDFTLDGEAFNGREYPYADITIQIFFGGQEICEPIFGVIRVSKYYKGHYGTYYHPITITSDELKNEVDFFRN